PRSPSSTNWRGRSSWCATRTPPPAAAAASASRSKATLGAGRSGAHLDVMRRLILITLMLAAAPLAANAQTWPGWPGPPPAGYDPGSAIADQHRIEMDRLRNQAAEREALAQQQRLQTRLTLQRL